MTANVNSILGVNLVAVNVGQNQTPANISLQGITLGCTSVFYDQFFQVPSSFAGTVQLPSPTVWVVYVRNVGANIITVSWTNTGGSTGTLQLSPVTNGFGGVFMFFQTAESGNGITTLTLQATSATTPAEVFAGY